MAPIRVVAAVLVVLTTACGWRKQHLIAGFGESRAAFDAQAPARPNGPAQAAVGLDSQEAAIISSTYRASLAPKETKPKEQPILIVSPPSRDQQPLAPSVPRER